MISGLIAMISGLYPGLIRAGVGLFTGGRGVVGVLGWARVGGR